MSIFDLFSKRQKKARGEVPDVYTYENLPQTLRVQIVHIIADTFGQDGYRTSRAQEAYEFVKRALCKEYGLFELVRNSGSVADEVLNFFLNEKSTERALDVVELCFKVINTHIRDNYSYQNSTTRRSEPDEAIAELNERFKEHGVGYQFESNEIIRVDSQLIHAEAIKPALQFLRGDIFSGANDEFLKAHEHYRHGRYKEALVDCLKAFESTMKAICGKRQWAYQQGDTAKALINICMTNGLVPNFQENQLNAVRILLESGVPTVRNKLGGHGQGEERVEVPGFMVRYALNLTATTVLMLAEAHESMR